MFCVLVWKCSRSNVNNGKYIVAVRGDVIVARPRSRVRMRIWAFVNVVYGIDDDTMPPLSSCFISLSSILQLRCSCSIDVFSWGKRYFDLDISGWSHQVRDQSITRSFDLVNPGCIIVASGPAGYEVKSVSTILCVFGLEMYHAVCRFSISGRNILAEKPWWEGLHKTKPEGNQARTT